MTNHIVQENLKIGTPESYWNVAHSDQIEGFTTDFSVDAGQTVDFKININGATAGNDYQVEIFRLGYYGGDGATLVSTLNNTSGTVQPNPLYDASRGLVDAGNWSVSDSWSVPSDAVSGVYLARLQRLDDNGNPIAGAVNQVPFVVRNDGVTADIVLQTSDTTWHAYNGWFGNNGQVGANFYGDASGTINHPNVQDPGIGAQDRAYALSYNRPFITRDATSPASGGQDYLFGADYAAIYWLERNGYDVTYISGIDADRLGTSWFEDGQGNTIREAYISVGHDEYWSGQQRANVEAARDAGVNLLFWSGNEVYWRTRYEESLDPSASDYRTLVSYKETWANGDPNASAAEYADIDPSSEWTGTWRDLRFVDSVDGNGNNTAVGAAPENSLTGQIFAPDGTFEFGGALDVPTEFASLRYWRDTTVQSGNGALDIAPGLVGYEWNVVLDDEYRPDGLIKISETILPWSGIVIDQGNREFPGSATHNLTLYRADSGALVFGSGTTFWTWGLSNRHDSSPYGASIEDARLQQFVVNLFADMGIQPASLQAGLAAAAASTDTVSATATISTALSQQIEALGNITISGTATDDDGNGATQDGAVALVEISFDGGLTWGPTEGTTNWSYDWIPTPGTYDILARAIDDSLNLPNTAGAPVQTVNVQVDQKRTLFDPAAAEYRTITNDNASVELGVQFVATEDGAISGLRYYRSWFDGSDTDVRTGSLWDANGNLLGSMTFTSTPGDVGWQTASFETPIDITAGNQYVASYHTDDNYVSTTGFFGTTYNSTFGTLSAPAAAGVFGYGTGTIFPNETFLNENYWIDPIFDAAIGGLTDSDLSADSLIENAVVGTTIGVTAFSLDPSPTYSLTSNPLNLFAIDPNTGVVTVIGVIDREAIGATTSFEVTAASTLGTRRAVFDVNIVDVDEFDVSTPVDNDPTENTVARLASIGSTVGVTALATDGDASTNAVTYALINNTNGYFAIDANSGVLTVASDPSGAAATEQITVLATSADGSTAIQTFDISVTDTAQIISLFDPGQAATGQITNDGSSVELGVQFQSSETGTITSLRYYRDAGDANDTDVRAGSLWDVNGNLLGSLTFTSSAGESGWQVANFATPISVTGGNLYVASYHTDDNYVSQQQFFSAPYNSPFGTLSAPVGAGVYRYSTNTIFPNQTYLNENYWIDAVFSFSTVGSLTDSDVTADSVSENVAVGTTVGITAFSPDTSPTYALTSNPDNLFAIDANTGVVTVANSIDREAVSATASIEVAATSTEGTRRSTFDVAIGDVDEFDVSIPVDSDPTDNSVARLAAVGATVGLSANAIDSDATTNAVSYALINNTNGYFTIDVNTGVATVASDLSGAAATEQIIVQATSADTSTVTQTFNIDVTDGPQIISLFDPGQAATGQITNDGLSLELGVYFESSQSGTITGLRYYRDAADANDTDVRAGSLWDANGNLLGSLTFTSTSGLSGWQTANFTTPIQITAGNLYVASYHTDDNYFSQSGFFDTAYNSPFGTLSAPVGAGGYRYDGDTIFPDLVYLNENYWVDALFSFSTVGSLTDSDVTADSVSENVAVGTTVGITAFSPDTSPTYVLTSNPDNLFAIDANTGVVTVANPIDREAVSATASIEVAATSTEGTRRSTFDVAIGDVDEFDVSSPVDNDPTDNSVVRQAAVGTTVGVSAIATDGDATTSAVTYSLINNTNGYFAIDTTTGVVTVVNDLVSAGAVEQITVQATSADSSTATQTFDVDITDALQTTSLFDQTQAVTGQAFNDGTGLELGVQFQSSQSGSISGLRYYRDAADSNDTDVRQGSLWDSNGNLLGSLTFTSALGESGWQNEDFSDPINITAGTQYVASYHTDDNYVSQSGFFANPYSDLTGTLAAPVSAGVYNYDANVAFPSQSYQNANYWVDAVFDFNV